MEICVTTGEGMGGRSIVCPVCGSSGLCYAGGGYLGKLYQCKNCGYVGAFVVEADEEMVRAIKECPAPHKELSKLRTIVKIILACIFIIIFAFFLKI